MFGPHVVNSMLEKRHGRKALTSHAHLNEAVMQNVQDYDDEMIAGKDSLIYKFGVGVIEGQELKFSPEKISIPGHKQDISLDIPNPYEDMT